MDSPEDKVAELQRDRGLLFAQTSTGIYIHLGKHLTSPRLFYIRTPLKSASAGAPASPCELLEVGPDLEARDPLRQDSARVAEGHAQDAPVLGAADALDALVARGALGVGDEPRQHHDLRRDEVQSLLLVAREHLLLQRAHLVQDVHHLRTQNGRVRMLMREGRLGRQERRKWMHIQTEQNVSDEGESLISPTRGSRSRKKAFTTDRSSIGDLWSTKCINHINVTKK